MLTHIARHLHGSLGHYTITVNQGQSFSRVNLRWDPLKFDWNPYC